MTNKARRVQDRGVTHFDLRFLSKGAVILFAALLPVLLSSWAAASMVQVLDLAQMPIPLPKGIPEWISPILSIIPGQLFAYHLTRHRGINPEAPRIITKITETN